MADSSRAVQQLIAAWQKSEALCALGAAGMMARVKAKECISRPDMCQNLAVILPIVENLGDLVALTCV